ncbi:MAG: hypothetical protein BJ554DRAFT_817 [Olpidium bornovanus]|uniref:U6 snRNA-associated Sm-like protein LSm1 n=1 Tax=Olpidium bornovanus TaxID=278681 RepID=A0A8H8DMF4_9FUNG|nr:MAG: hypothetical protein BJ554DRAFT_817 [Olpidium bornovanus]
MDNFLPGSASLVDAVDSELGRRQRRRRQEKKKEKRCTPPLSSSPPPHPRPTGKRGVEASAVRRGKGRDPANRDSASPGWAEGRRGRFAWGRERGEGGVGRGSAVPRDFASAARPDSLRLPPRTSLSFSLSVAFLFPGAERPTTAPFPRRSPPFRPPNLPSTAGSYKEKLLVMLRDGRKLIGVLRSYDQFANLVLQDTIERVYVGDAYGDIARGVLVVRGENVVLLGEIDLDREEELPLRRVPVETILAAQQAEIESRQRREKAKARVLHERGFAANFEETDAY